MSKQALNYLLGELERLDYLERRPDPDDLRSKRIALTRRGNAAVRVIREAVGEESIYLGPLTIAFSGGHRGRDGHLIGGHVYAFALSGRRHDVGVFDCL